MCGIVGYIGRKQSFDILIAGLKSLEYRGYDSAGIALLDGNGHLKVHKAAGKVDNLVAVTKGHDLTANIGIAHTRWATHGKPTDINAHPHCSMSGRLALVHNGIIENFEVLKEMLVAHGFEFKSATDTEVLVQLIEYYQNSQDLSLVDAVRSALRLVQGSYAIAVVDKTDTDTVIAARRSSPLVIGVGSGEFYIASDATPFAQYTQKVVYLDDYQVAEMHRDKDLIVTDLNGSKVDFKMQDLDISLDQLGMGSYPHYMLKEIFEQKETIGAALKGRIVGDKINMENLDNDRLKAARRIVLVACGTSWHAALVAKYALEKFAHIPAEVDYASEFRYRNPILYSDDIVVAISQSGETADTLAAIELAKKSSAYTIGICNVKGSSIARQTDSCCYTCVGPEIGVASTKAFTGQLVVLMLLALNMAEVRKTMSDDAFKEVVSALLRLPSQIPQVLQQDSLIEMIANKYATSSDFLYLGRDICYPIALEGALKLKEISYIHAEGYPAAEMKHGPIALISPELPTFVIATDSEIYGKLVSNIMEVKARNGQVIAVVTEGDKTVRDIADHVIEVPRTLPDLYPILAVIPLQLFSYHIAVTRGCDVDQPRNLAKSVTVE